MPLSPGDKLGPYEIVEKIGAGGMGEVYRAHDPRLRRDVAIKVSPEKFSERFEREARAIASLNHPNICTLHDIGPNYLVMELVEGEAPKGPLPLEEALRIARQIRDALEEAHSKGIVHRDLKPGNIKIKPDGVVKVLDFGLAKQTGPAPEGKGEDSPTMSMAATQAGMILGTAAYMAPEQAKGRNVDKRADIWAFGVVLYEMVSGDRLFKGDDISEILASVIKEKPDLSAVPAKVRPLLERCLEKDPGKRLRDIGDMDLLLQGAPVEVGHARRLPWIWPVTAATFALLTAVALWAPWRKAPAPPEVVKFEIFAPEKNRMQKFVVSPDGRKIAFYADGPTSGGLWVRSLDSVESRRVAETVIDPPLFFWSPDSQSIAFPGGAGSNKLMKVDVSGGPPQTLCEVKSIIAGGSWNRDGTIVFGSLAPGAVWRVSAAGGTPAAVTSIDASRQEQGHFSPVLLPDGKHFLYLRRSPVADDNGIYAGSLDAKPEQQSLKRLVGTDVGVVFTPSENPDEGKVLFLREGALLAQDFDLRKLEMRGEPVPLADHLGSAYEFGYFGASTNGVLAYRAGGAAGFNGSQLSWFDRQGKILGSATMPGNYNTVALSPDSARVAVSRYADSVNQDVWILEFARNIFTRMTSDASPDLDPVWSPDGSQVAYVSYRIGGGLYKRASNAGGGEELLLPLNVLGTELDDWSRDGKFLLFSGPGQKTKNDLFTLSMTPEKPNEARKPTVYLDSEFNETEGQFSPDGHWVAYVSDESGKPEVYIQPFPLATGGAGKWTVSNGGGIMPRWRRDGKELFYTAAGSVMATDVTYTPSLKTSVPKVLFQASIQNAGPNEFVWDATADGKKFLIEIPASQTNGPQSPLTVVLNWPSLLKK